MSIESAPVSGHLITLVSDTETRPSPGMRAAIAAAEVGDEQRGEDPTVNRLQERVAELVGKEAALWFPGGTMCNFVSIKIHTRPADAILVEAMAHITRAESAGAAASSGVQIEPIASDRGIFTPAALEEALGRLGTVPQPYSPKARLVCVEQSHNFGGGSVWSHEALAAVQRCARSHQLALHMDGARLLNACIALGVQASVFGSLVDSLWLDFTKGLGAPIGAVLAGSKDFIAEARRQKHIFGGAMRQAGIAAAGCLYALDHNVERLAEDHQNARRLADGLGQIEGIRVRTPKPETNMVFFSVTDLGLSNARFLETLAHAGVRLGATGGEIRAVTHLDVGAQDIDTVLQAVNALARAARPTR